MYRVLLVNDCKLENFIMRDMLLNLGYEVIISNELDAVRDAHELNCNAVIANFIMKEKTGDKILELIKNRYPKTKCILSSSNDIKLNRFNNEIIDAFIRTPVNKEKLQEVLNKSEKIINNHIKQLKPSFCKFCGEKLDDSDVEVKFCKYCGKKYKL